jgi:hypothetical protein
VPGPEGLSGGQPLHQLHRLLPAVADQGPQPLPGPPAASPNIVKRPYFDTLFSENSVFL